MTSREEFEAHARRDHDFEDGDFRMLSNGKYYWGTTQMIWETWQAARA